MAELSGIEALTFDIGGTVFDWRGTIEEEVSRLVEAKGADVDVRQFATDWRRGMFAMLARVRTGELPWMNADQLHRRMLDDVLAVHTGLELSSAERDELNEVWHRLRAWPDAADAIRRLRSRYKVVVLTVLSWSIAIDCSRHNGIDWDGILSCEFLGHYKSDPPAYWSAVKLLRLEPSQAMMVAAHTNDLHAATGIGMRSAYVHRQGESPGTFGTDEVTAQTSGFDVSAKDFPELADMLLA